MGAINDKSHDGETTSGTTKSTVGALKIRSWSGAI